MRKSLIAFFVAILLIMPFQTKAESAPISPTQDSTELRLQDMLSLFLTPNITGDVGKYYQSLLKLTPEIEPWHIDVVQTQRVNGFRGFILLMTLEVEPTLGLHVPVGKDRIEYQISVGPSVKLVNYTHLSSYKLPSDLQEFVR